MKNSDYDVISYCLLKECICINGMLNQKCISKCMKICMKRHLVQFCRAVDHHLNFVKGSPVHDTCAHREPAHTLCSC